MFEKIHTVCKITRCEKSFTLQVKLHNVCKVTHCVHTYTLCVKLHFVCKIHTEYWSSFLFHCEKFPSVKKFTLAPLLMLVTNMRYATILIMACIMMMYLFKIAVASNAYGIRRPVPPSNAPAVRGLPHACRSHWAVSERRKLVAKHFDKARNF